MSLLSLAFDRIGRHRARRTSGRVQIVGVGPGDPELLTLKALNALRSSDIVFYDDLVSSPILRHIRRGAERVFVGKRRGRPGIGQSEIHRRMIEAAKAGRQVVRLKGGDPFVFGRGGEERAALEAAGVPVTVVPGITAALGCAAEAGVPLTLRGIATRLSIVTASTAEGAERLDWSGLADRRTTVAVYMGLSAARIVKDRLIAAGRDPRTPVAVLARGTRADSRSVAGRLWQLPALAAETVEGPALIVVGEAVAQSRIWYETIAASRNVVEAAA